MQIRRVQIDYFVQIGLIYETTILIDPVFQTVISLLI